MSVTGYPIHVSGMLWDEIENYIEADDTPFDPDEWTFHKIGRGCQMRAVLSEEQLGELIWLMESRVSYPNSEDKAHPAYRQLVLTARRLRSEHPDLYTNGREWQNWREADGSEAWGWGVPV